MINKRQEKELADLIDESVFKRSEFDVTDASINIYKEEKYKSITYKGTKYYFHIHKGDFAGSYYVEFSPNDVDLVKTSDNIDWGEVKHNFDFWLINLKEELDVKDIWTSVSGKLFEIGDAEVIDEKFTDEEIKLLEARIEEVKVEVQKNTSIPVEKKNLLLESFDYFKKVAKKVTKLDWTNIVIGQVMRVIITEENKNFVLGLLKHIFKEYILPNG